MNALGVVIREFGASDQFETKALIEAGLKERFEPYLEEYNPDLENLEQNFLMLFVATASGQIVACGGLKAESQTTARIARMSTKLEFRGRGLAAIVLERLTLEAKIRGFTRLVLETNTTWTDAIRLYQKAGFQARRVFMFDSNLELTEFELELV